MHLRRALLLMAVVLCSVAIVEALVPAPRDRDGSAAPAAPPAPRGNARVRTIELRHPAAKAVPRTEVAPGTRVVVEVSTSVAGEASIADLGLVQPGDRNTPARFDVLAARPGSYEITFDPAAGEPDTLGRLVVRRSG
jgi:hypothetical protein